MDCNSNNHSCSRNSCGCNQSQGYQPFTLNDGYGFNNFNNGFNGYSNGYPFNGTPRANPIVAPKRVCISNQTQFVEQPVICPVECRRVNNVVYYPKYYPNYYYTTCNQNSQNF